MPGPDALLAAAVVALRRRILPATSGAVAFEVRVLANALELVRRQLAGEADGEAALTALAAVAGEGNDGEAAGILRAAAEGLRSGAIPLEAAGLFDALSQLALAKIAVDQPDYAGCAGIRRPERPGGG